MKAPAPSSFPGEKAADELVDKHDPVRISDAGERHPRASEAFPRGGERAPGIPDLCPAEIAVGGLLVLPRHREDGPRRLVPLGRLREAPLRGQGTGDVEIAPRDRDRAPLPGDAVPGPSIPLGSTLVQCPCLPGVPGFTLEEAPDGEHLARREQLVLVVQEDVEIGAQESPGCVIARLQDQREDRTIGAPRRLDDLVV